MADYPCDLHNARYAGPSTRVFVNAYRDDMVVALRLTVCEPCLEGVVADWLTSASVRSDGGYWDPTPADTGLDGLWRPQEAPQRGRNGSKYR